MTDTQNYRLSLRTQKAGTEQLPQTKKNDRLTSQDAKLHPADREAI